MSYILYVRMTEADGRRLEGLAGNLNRDRADLVREIILAGLTWKERKLKMTAKIKN